MAGNGAVLNADGVVVPKLMRLYLDYGARICSAPAIDRDFKTIDFLIWFDFEAMQPELVPDAIRTFDVRRRHEQFHAVARRRTADLFDEAVVIVDDRRRRVAAPFVAERLQVTESQLDDMLDPNSPPTILPVETRQRMSRIDTTPELARALLTNLEPVLLRLVAEEPE